MAQKGNQPSNTRVAFANLFDFSVSLGSIFLVNMVAEKPVQGVTKQFADVLKSVPVLQNIYKSEQQAEEAAGYMVQGMIPALGKLAGLSLQLTDSEVKGAGAVGKVVGNNLAAGAVSSVLVTALKLGFSDVLDPIKKLIGRVLNYTAPEMSEEKKLAISQGVAGELLNTVATTGLNIVFNQLSVSRGR